MEILMLEICALNNCASHSRYFSDKLDAHFLKLEQMFVGKNYIWYNIPKSREKIGEDIKILSYSIVKVIILAENRRKKVFLYFSVPLPDYPNQFKIISQIYK